MLESFHWKWNRQVDNMVSNVTKHVSIVRKQKYKIKRKENFKKNIVMYIRPFLEFAYELLENFGSLKQNKNNLEKLKSQAAIMVTGMAIF